MLDELACVYAALLLQDDDIIVTGEKISTILKAAKVDVQPYWPTLFSQALESFNLKDLITNVGSSVGSVGTVAAPVAATAQVEEKSKPEEKAKEKEEEKEESDEDMGFSLFD